MSRRWLTLLACSLVLLGPWAGQVTAHPAPGQTSLSAASDYAGGELARSGDGLRELTSGLLAHTPARDARSSSSRHAGLARPRPGTRVAGDRPGPAERVPTRKLIGPQASRRSGGEPPA